MQYDNILDLFDEEWEEHLRSLGLSIKVIEDNQNANSSTNTDDPNGDNLSGYSMDN